MSLLTVSLIGRSRPGKLVTCGCMLDPEADDGPAVEEALKLYERFLEAGFDVTVITPDGQPPYADPYGLSWF
jgi:hypothetical protein